MCTYEKKLGGIYEVIGTYSHLTGILTAITFKLLSFDDCSIDWYIGTYETLQGFASLDEILQ
jgi:hypothetical protein